MQSLATAKHIKIIIAIVFLVLGSQQAVAQPTATIYVDNELQRQQCDDYDPESRQCGQGQFKALASLSVAAREAQPGVRILIQPGEYNSGIVVTTSGSEQQPIVFEGVEAGVIIDAKGEGRDAFFINDADHIIIDRITIKNANRAALRISLSDYVTVRNSVFADNGTWGVFTDFSNFTVIENSEAFGSKRQHGIYISNSSDNAVIRGNRIHNNVSAGIHMNGDASMGGDGIASNALIENNIIYENGSRGASAINLDGVTDSVVRNNLLYDNHASGISLYQVDGASESHSNLVLHNTIIMARDARWALNVQNSGNTKLFNNIVLNNNRFRGSIYVNSPVAEDFESDFNLVMNAFQIEGTFGRMSLEDWQSRGYDQHSYIERASDIFIDEREHNFRLKEASVAKDNGKPLREVLTDLEGKNRPSGAGYDIGAFEH
jgi:parallel beta-helix repeat protein